MELLGEMAALTTAFCWGGGTLLFAAAGRRIGSYNVNKLRIPMSAVFLGTLLLVMHGSFFPTGIDSRTTILLTLSGIIGLIIGDTCYFRCLVILGPRRGALLESLSPPITAIAAFFFLDERLGLLAILGLIITLAGVAWVTTDKKDDRMDNREGSKAFGVLMGVFGAAGQSFGLIIAKEAMGDSFDPLSATFIRMVASSLGIWIIAAFRREIVTTMTHLTDKKALFTLMGAAFVGPTIGVWMSLVAVKHTHAGIAATIMSTFPIIVIPLTMIVHKEKPTMRSVVGAIVAIAGVALLFIE
ncbi:MAG: DMT family transporter [Candidatus Zixiibacteriota bacterium]